MVDVAHFVVLAMRRPHTWLIHLVLSLLCRAAIIRSPALCLVLGVSAACQTLILNAAEQVVGITLKYCLCLALLAVLQTTFSMMQGSDEVVEMNKSIRLKMFLPSQRLHVVYPHQRSQEFFTNTPGQAGLPHLLVLVQLELCAVVLSWNCWPWP